MREYHLPSEYSLYDFKRFIVSELGFDDSQQSVFFMLDKNERKIESYSLFDMDTVTLEDLKNRGMKILLYTFDMFNDRSLHIEFQGEVEALPRINYPLVAQSKGDAPGQFFEKIEDDELDEKMPLYDDDDYDEEELYDDYSD